MELEVSNIRRRLSTAAARADNTVFVARMSQVEEGSGLASKGREERNMEHSREADWLVHSTIGVGKVRGHLSDTTAKVIIIYFKFKYWVFKY